MRARLVPAQNVLHGLLGVPTHNHLQAVGLRGDPKMFHPLLEGLLGVIGRLWRELQEPDICAYIHAHAMYRTVYMYRLDKLLVTIVGNENLEQVVSCGAAFLPLKVYLRIDFEFSRSCFRTANPAQLGFVCIHSLHVFDWLL